MTVHTLLPAFDEWGERIVEKYGTSNPVVIANRMGMRVVMSNLPRMVKACLCRGRDGVPDSILVNRRMGYWRRNYAIAHEIAEHLVSAMGVHADEEDEPIIDRCAAAIMMPRTAFTMALMRYGPDVVMIHRKFPFASHEALARRILDFLPNAVLTICDDHEIVLRLQHCGEPAVGIPISKHEMDAIEAVRTGRVRQITERDGAVVFAARITSSTSALVRIIALRV